VTLEVEGVRLFRSEAAQHWGDRDRSCIKNGSSAISRARPRSCDSALRRQCRAAAVPVLYEDAIQRAAARVSAS
jgi:hypothetical protein